jgi:phage terminase large subunit-like protein
VFNNYERYKELEGNGYIDAIMANVYALYRIHYGFDEQEKK